MSRKKRVFSIDSIEEAAVNFFNYLLQEKPKIPFFIPFILIACAIEKWVFSFSTWVPLALAVWATIQVLIHHLAIFSFYFINLLVFILIYLLW
jgi:hypothetical protein